MIDLNYLGSISGAGTPNYLNGAYAIDFAPIGPYQAVAVVSFDDNSLSMFDIDDPATPVLLDSIQGSGGPNYLAGASGVKLIEIGGTWHVVVTAFLDSAVTIFDVSDPTNITKISEMRDGVGGFDLLGGAYGLDVVTIAATEHALVTSITDDALTVIDISTPAVPVETDTLSGTGAPNFLNGAHGVVGAEIGSNWYAFVVSTFDHSLTVVDIDTPAAIVLEVVVEGEGSPEYLSGAHSIEYQLINAVEHVIISSYGEDTIVLYDVSAPGSPSFVSKLSDGQDPYYLEEVCLVKAVVIGTDILVFTTGYLDDSVTAFSAADPANLTVAAVINGAGSPNFLAGAHGLFVDSSNLIVTGYNEDSFSIFGIDISFVEGAVSMDATTSITAEGTVGGQVWGAVSMDAVSYIRAGTSLTETDWDIFLDEIRKPHWYPIKRAYMLDINGVEVDITDKVEDYDRVLWQMEQPLHINDFTANNCNLRLKNESEEFDIDNADNFFVTELNRYQDGYKTPVLIKVGYMSNGEALLIPMFYGLLIDIDTSTMNDIAILDLQCVSRTLRDAPTHDIGGEWVNQRLYGGDTFTYITDDVVAYNEPYIKVSGDGFPDNFPPTGYIRIEDEIIYHGNVSANGFGDCLRGRLGTTPAQHDNGTFVTIVMDDGRDTEGRFFQFPVYPISKESIVSVSSSDGEISLRDDEILLNIPYEEKKLIGFVHYDIGILELAGKPTDSGSLIATYKTCPRNITYDRLAAMVLESQSFSTSLVDVANLSNSMGLNEPIDYGRITHAWYSNTLTALSGLNANDMTTDAEGNIYIAVGSSIIKWDGIEYSLIADFGTDNEIFRLVLDSNGDFYGISGTENFILDDADKLKDVFKYDGTTLTFLITGEAAYLHFADSAYNSYGIDGAQWKGFSVDEDGGYVYYLYRTGGVGLARVPMAGGAVTRWSRTITGTNWRAIDFVDTGLYIEFFYRNANGIQYDRFTKAGTSWTSVGEVFTGFGYDNIIPFILGYNSDDGNIYYNVAANIITRPGEPDVDSNWGLGGFYSVPVNTAVETQLVEYDNTDTRWDRYTGGVYYDGYIWCVRGTAFALGDERDSRTGEIIGDGATGHLYRIANDVIDDQGAIAYRPLSEDIISLRNNVKGISANLAIRSTDGAVFFVASDATVSLDEKYGHSFGVYNAEYKPVIEVANLNDRNAWDVLSELAKLVNYELGVSREGEVFWRKRTRDYTQLATNINSSDTTITSDGTFMDSFSSDGGLMQIGQEIITYTGISSNDFTGCTRGERSSTAAGHDAPATIWSIKAVLTNEMAHEASLKFARKTLNLEDIYNHITVPYGRLKAVCDWEKAGEEYNDSSEAQYGKKPYTVDNNFLSEKDDALAQAIAWRYYDQYHLRKTALELETKWQPQLDLGDMISVRQDTRTLLTFDVSNIRRIEVMMEDFFVRCYAKVRPSRYRGDVYEYPYEYHEF